MEFLILTFIFILGLIIGSFLNVVILRFGTDKSIVKGNSGCPKCGKDLKWYELVPVLSWVLLRGKCSKCKEKISVQYPLVELATGLLFVLQYLQISDLEFVSLFVLSVSYFIAFVAMSLLVVIFVFDLYHKIIPDTFSFMFGVLGLVYMFMNFQGWDLLAPVFFFVPFYLLWRISNGTWIGLGDGKLAFGFGGFLGIAYGASALVLSFWIGAIFAIGLMLWCRLKSSSKDITMKTEVAFGPFMIIAFLIVYFCKIDVTGLATLLNGF